MKKNLLCIIDPQNDFIQPEYALPVNGAIQDMQRLTALINKNGDMFDSIIVTMDSHNPIHIASTIYWADKDGNHPRPFTTITSQDLKNNIWKPLYNRESAEEYLEKLENAGKNHTIWPSHTLYGSQGWAIYKPLYEALYEWSFKYDRKFTLYTKGQDSENTEMFSVVQPEVSLNPEHDKRNAEKIMSIISQYQNIYIAGEAEDFCVKESVKDFITINPELANKIVILTDCMSRIIKDNSSTDNFWNNCKDLGMNFKNAADI